MAAEPAAEVDALVDWLLGQGLLATPVGHVLAETASRLRAAGVPVTRGHISGTLLDPQFEAMGYTWTDGAGVESSVFTHQDARLGEAWQLSPLRWVIEERAREVAARNRPAETAREMLYSRRFRIAEGEGVQRFPMIRELADGGATDYLVYVLPYFFEGGVAETLDNGVVGSWTTHVPGGFTEADLAALRTVTPAMAVAARSHVFYMAGLSLTTTYLGQEAGRRVLKGSIRRGETLTIGTALLLGDLRGFTRLSETYDRNRLVQSLDGYLSCMADPVDAHGGEVLKFLGDGMLASFALSADDRTARCRDALAAAEAVLQRTAQFNQNRSDAGEPTMPVDLALHVGEVFYGNVGSERRLDFTVIGPAVNECSRIEAMCDALGTPLLASADFVRAGALADRFVSLGSHTLRGVDEPRELFTLAGLATAR
ncbi:MAG: adenylate/guanylate cyclase domain-containing protein [Rhodospirillaceae bacterium]|nr:adenylate/guanylate cyclase domain-containing protein [Rhodospirillaceae bacterium]